MKNYLIFCIALCFSSVLFAQDGDVNILDHTQLDFNRTSLFDSVYIPEKQDRIDSHILWKKTVWRVIDMREQSNFPLYYPLQEVDGRKNLFSCIFSLLQEGKINAYAYDEKKEDFSEEARLSFEDVLKECEVDVFDTSMDQDGNLQYDINEVDLPTANVLKFYIKEVWYFDAMESAMKFKIEAIAPQLYSLDEVGGTKKNVMFWVPFEELRPWIARCPVVINNMNATASISYDDLFQKRRFVGHIYKDDNLQNRSIIQFCSTPLEVRMEQKRIENEIVNFEMDLWEH